MKTIGITGGTGLLGTHLSRLLAESGYDIIVFTRNPEKKRKYIKNTTYAGWDPYKKEIDLESLAKVNVMVHLSGAGVADKRWTEQRKRTIVNSRVESTKFLVEALKHNAPNCNTLICSSAIGYYGTDTTDKPFTETDPPANDFLARTCVEWEKASEGTDKLLRKVIFRVGVVLARESGALHELLRPMKFGFITILGSGEQMVSWIHITDMVRMLRFAIERTEVSGIYNAVAPKPVTHSNLMSNAAANRKGIKVFLPVPAPLLKLTVGELSTEVLKSCTVSAQKIIDAGFRFEYNYIDTALKDLMSRKKKK